MNGILDPTPTFDYPQLALAQGVTLPGKLQAIVSALRARNIGYSPDGEETPGWKPLTLAQQADQFVGISSNGAHGPYTDCSGFACYCLWHLTGGGIALAPEITGSAALHGWAKRIGFKTSTPGAGELTDGVLRIGFLSAHGGHSGHVLFMIDGQTYESHGGKGPDSRVLADLAWAEDLDVYVLRMP